jgi:hypothetical protein
MRFSFDCLSLVWIRDGLDGYSSCAVLTVGSIALPATVARLGHRSILLERMPSSGRSSTMSWEVGGEGWSRWIDLVMYDGSKVLGEGMSVVFRLPCVEDLAALHCLL